MTKKRLLRFIIIMPIVIVLAAVVSTFSVVRDWQLQWSIPIVDGAKRLFDSTWQFGGNYKQKSLYYWSPQEVAEIKQFYQDFTLTPFVENDSDGESWMIAALKGSKLRTDPYRQPYIHTDLCDYTEVFACTTISLFDVKHAALSHMLQGMYSLSESKIQALPTSGTLIVFTYNIPDLA